ncbi:MAG: hypothetical protein QOG48_298 [Verrucomicrobiota bacterium]|jgi:hypothetical protein
MSDVLNLILAHQSAPTVTKMIDYWSKCVPRDNILIAYGGNKSEFDAIDYAQKFFVDDARLRTSDHQREFQSYTGLLRATAAWIDNQSRRFDFVHFAEYDHLPLVNDLNPRQIASLTAERADLLGYSLARVDETNHPHFLYHSANPEFAAFWRRITCRADANVVLSIFGSGSFWTREAFCAVAAIDEPFPIYTELYLPTLAHHVGFRVRSFDEQQHPFVQAVGDATGKIDNARAQGAWTLHPVKQFWTN